MQIFFSITTLQVSETAVSNMQVGTK